MVVADGRYTGQVDYYAYGPNKAAAMRELAEAAGYDLADCYAYSDSITDLPMLEAVGHPAAVNPDRALRRAARERGWPILVFTRPVSLRSRLAGLRAPRKPMVGTAVGVGAAVAGIAWYAARRRTAPPVREVAEEQPAARRSANAFLMRWSSVLRSGGVQQMHGRRLQVDEFPSTRLRARTPGTHARPAAGGTSGLT
jgi:hypothetical protein